MIINHQLIEKDFFIPSWKIKHLFLGTFNPEGGACVAYFYGRPTNFTWDILSEKFTEIFNRNDITDLLSKLEKHQVACMDVIRSVDASEDRVPDIIGKGYSDAKIINNKVSRNYNTKFINEVIKKNPSAKVYSTWGAGSTLKNWTQ